MRKLLQSAGLLLLAGLLAVSAVACGDDDGDDDGDNESDATTEATSAAVATTPAEASSVSISIVEPAEGFAVEGDRLVIQVEVDGLALDGTKIGLPAGDNEGVGHWHVYVDGEYAGLSVSDVVSLPNDAMPAISAGEHDISVQLHNTDHTPVMPEATDAITVEFPEALAAPAADGEEASIEIVSPAADETVDGRFEVQVAVQGVLLDGTKIGLPADENPGVGHWHVYVDGEYAGLSVTDVISLPNDAMPSIAPGTHEISVQIHNTDHTPLLPEATDSVTVTVQ